MAGGTSKPACATCTDVLVNLVHPSTSSCDTGSHQLVEITIDYTPESGLPPADGFCVNFETVNAHPLIVDFSAVA